MAPGLPTRVCFCQWPPACQGSAELRPHIDGKDGEQLACRNSGCLKLQGCSATRDTLGWGLPELAATPLSKLRHKQNSAASRSVDLLTSGIPEGLHLASHVAVPAAVTCVSSKGQGSLCRASCSRRRHGLKPDGQPHIPNVQAHLEQSFLAWFQEVLLTVQQSMQYKQNTARPTWWGSQKQSHLACPGRARP